MRARRIDDNQKQVVKNLRQLGLSVVIVSMVPVGFDFIIGHKGKNYLIELKDGQKVKSKKKLTENETDFFNNWRGQVNKCETIEEILFVIGL